MSSSQPSSATTYLLIDESGNPVFYGNRKKLLIHKDGFQPYLVPIRKIPNSLATGSKYRRPCGENFNVIYFPDRHLIIGLIETKNRRALREAILNFKNIIKADNLYNSIPSVTAERGWYVHARGDHPEIRAKFFELLRSLNGYTAHIVIAWKDLDIFNRKHNNNPTEFYFDVLHHLLKGRFQNTVGTYRLYLSQRGNNSLHWFQSAVDKALRVNEADAIKRIQYSLETVPATEMPELSIIEYLIWAVQRKLLTGESRYFNALKDKYETVINLYEGEQ